MSVQTPADARHIHTIKEITIKEHKKASDGSCTTTYYYGEKCTSCGLTGKDDVINVITTKKCTH